MTPDPTRPKRRLIFLALTGTARNRRAVRTLASTVGWLTSRLSRLVPGRGRPTLAIHAPAADGKAYDWPSGVDVVALEDALEPEDWRAAMARAEREADRLVAGDVPWPEWAGIRVAPLNWTHLAEFFVDYGVMAAGLRRLLGDGRWTSCTIITGYPRLGQALRAEAVATGIGASHVSLPPLRGPRRDSERTWPHDPEWPAAAARDVRTLFVSESYPMREMFDRVEARMDDADLSDFLRVQYVTSDSGPPEDGRHLLWPRPDHYDLPEAEDSPEVSIPRLHDGLTTPPPAVDLVLSGMEADILPRQWSHLARVRELLERVEPALVVVGNDRWWLGRSFTLVARAMGIRTLAVQDGIATNEVRFRAWSADCIAVNGHHLRDILVDAGCPENRIVEVGQPRYDGIRMAPMDGGPETPELIRVMFATQPNQDATYVGAVLGALADAEVDIDLRPHPSTAPARLEELRSLADATSARWCADEGIHDLLERADLVLVQNSTVAVEAALLGKPVITVNLTGSPPLVPYADLGISREVADLVSLTDAIRDAAAGRLPTVRTSRRTRDGVEYLLGPCDGDAARRVVTVIGDLLAQASPEE